MNTSTLLLALRAKDDNQFNPGGEGLYLLQILAWCVSAAGVGGVIIVGIQLAIQIQRGTQGEGASYARSLAIVLGACVLAASAGPLVEFLGPFDLAPPQLPPN